MVNFVWRCDLDNKLNEADKPVGIEFFAKGKEMRRFIIVGVVLVVAGILISLSAVLGYSTRLDMVHACSGTVVDSNGKPVANARVGIITCGGEAAVSYSNHKGIWQVCGLPENSEHLGHVGGYFVTHPDYVGISWSVSQKMEKVVLITPVSLRVKLKEISNLQYIYAEPVDVYKTELVTHYPKRNISPYPSPSRKYVDDGLELSPLIPSPYKVTVKFRGRKPPLVKYIDTREETELWF
jgi:hypothetical protein